MWVSLMAFILLLCLVLYLFLGLVWEKKEKKKTSC